ncbi:SAF domain-containing protein [Sanguibacter gelidistatuariae]|uniref:SAF domain-containing protein n=1 Tax=Sanguibacter gelidistatuariae TaxID=1814289 RepID=A0A1G6T2F0_9MICO|nr:SAF domain-containing protein [Sanguibacter gelidistatuariae]SDD23189.1 SAF domain-containing protein [Sanguibacter gelidistatuariae]
MTTTRRTSGQAPTTAKARPGTLSAPALAVPQGRRRPGLLALGIALTALGALVAAWLVTGASDRTSVIVLAHDVAYGEVITQTDLSVTDVAVDPTVTTVPAADAGGLVGLVATTNLLAGTLLNPAHLAAQMPPGEGQVLVPLALAANRLPVGGLHAGDTLLVVATPQPGQDTAATATAATQVTVVRVGAADLNGVSVIDVVVDADAGPALAALSASGDIAVVLQPAGGQS